MSDPISLGRMPLKHDHAEQNLLLILVGFSVSVIATRSFLGLTSYPQIASGDFHIARVLWGGLLLYVASLLVLIWRGRRIHWFSSLLTGLSFGLFIDEIGKSSPGTTTISTRWQLFGFMGFSCSACWFTYRAGSRDRTKPRQRHIVSWTSSSGASIRT